MHPLSADTIHPLQGGIGMALEFGFADLLLTATPDYRRFPTC
jgi:hypothetical protein